MSTGNSQNAKQRLIILCTTKSLTNRFDMTLILHLTKKNCLSNSPSTFSIAVKIARYLVYKMSLVLCD